MAITDNATAMAVSTLLTWLMPSLEQCGRPAPSLDAALRAAETLANAASKHIMAGPNAAAVRTSAAIDGARLQMLCQRTDA